MNALAIYPKPIKSELIWPKLISLKLIPTNAQFLYPAKQAALTFPI